MLHHDKLLFAKELYGRRQSLTLRFDPARTWLLQVQQGRLALDLDQRARTLLLDANATRLCITRAAIQEITVLQAPLRLLRLGLPASLCTTPAEHAGPQQLPLLEPMFELLERAEAGGVDAATRAGLTQALQAYWGTELQQLGLTLQATGVDPLQQLLDWLRPRLQEEVQLADLAGAACLSARRLQELCQQRFGCSPMDLVRRLRIEALHSDLQDPAQAQQGLAQLYRRWHLPDSSGTRKAFEARYGQSPARLRRQLAAAAARS